MQNFNSIRQPIEIMKVTIVWMSWLSWNFVRSHEILFQTDTESLSFLSWKTKKVLSPQKNFFLAVVSKHAKIIPKDGANCPNFQWRFWVEQDRSRNISPIQSEKLGTEMPVKIVLVNLFYCDREHLIELPFNWYLITVWNSKRFSVIRLNYILLC